MVGFANGDPETAYQDAADANVDPDSEFSDWQERVGGVINKLPPRLKDATNSMEYAAEYTAAAGILVDLAEDTGEAAWVEDFIDDSVSGIAQDIGHKVTADEIASGVLVPVREVRREQNRERFDELAAESEGRYSLDSDKVGIDEYVETTLKCVIRAEITDHDDDPDWIFEFKDGTTVTFTDNKHRDYQEFQEQIATASPTDARVMKELASRQALDDIKEDVEEAYGEKQYRKLSHGPESRPWGIPSDKLNWWDEVVTSLESGAETDVSIGPNTDALHDLQNKIQNATIAYDIQSVVDAGDRAVYFSKEHGEVWVPNSMIDAAWEDYATSRKNFRLEICDRGIDTDEKSGKKISEVVGTVTPATRFWRLNADHPEMRGCVDKSEIVDEIERGNGGFAAAGGYANSVDAATDSGVDDESESDA